MSIKRITTILLALLSYIALAGAAQSLIKHFASKPTQQRYAELRLGSANQIQVLICKDWRFEANDMADELDLSQDSGSVETGQDIYYWINFQGNRPAASVTNYDVHVNGTTHQRSFRGVINLAPNRSQVTINLFRVSASLDQPAQTIPCPANGTYQIRNITKTPF
jgi:hypothetical protein